MTVDYLSTLNSKGSGLNISQIVDSLVQAEVQPKRTLITKSQSATELKISELADLKAKANTFQSQLGSLSFAKSFKIENSNTAAIEVINTSVLHEAESFSSNIDVKQLARKQTLLFEGYNATAEQIGDINLSISFGKVAEDLESATDDNVFDVNNALSTQQLSLSDATLEELSNALNALEGISSEILKLSETNYALAVYSDFGADNALKITSNIEGLSASSVTEYQSVQKVSAQNAILELNGIEIERSTNTIDDVIDGKTLTLKAISEQSISISGDFDAEIAKNLMLDFVDTLNDFKRHLANLTQRNIDGLSQSPFSSDAAVKGMYTQLNNLLREPLAGFGTSDIYLAQMGVMTNRDGSISLNEDKFENFFETNNSNFFALSDNYYNDPSNSIQIEILDTKDQIPGSFDFVFDADTGEATLDNKTLVKSVIGDNTIFRSEDVGFSGIQLTVATNSIPASTTLNVGISASQKLSNLISGFLNSNGEIAQKEKVFDEDMSNFETDLLSLVDKENTTRARYIEQFTAMEQIVTKLKSTGDYITTIMDAWNKEDN
ncbi:flagellar capping protein [Rhodobacteraceae bacterium HIMB11]|nr:flagellar capping protein [Rhodobacteraceae bacterium HIMB11]